MTVLESVLAKNVNYTATESSRLAMIITKTVIGGF